MLVKICGTTSEEDAILAARAGADYLGVIIEHEVSRRSVSLETAERIGQTLRGAGIDILLVAVTVNLPLSQLLLIRHSFQPDVFQLHGDEPPSVVADLVDRGMRVWATCGDGSTPRERATALLEAGAEAVLVDARAQRADGATLYGGTGLLSNWTLARVLSDGGARLVLSGGLDAHNVKDAMAATNPWMVDAVSGVEAHPGTKDVDKVRAFIAAAKN